MNFHPNKQESIQVHHPTQPFLKIQVRASKCGFRVENMASLPVTVDYAGKQYLSKHIHFFDRSAPNVEDFQCHQNTDQHKEDMILKDWAKRLGKFENKLDSQARLQENRHLALMSWSQSLNELELELDERAMVIRESEALKEHLELQSEASDERERENQDEEIRLRRFQDNLSAREHEADEREAKLKTSESVWQNHREVQQSLMDARVRELKAREGRVPDHFTREDHPEDLFVFKENGRRASFLRKYLHHIERYNP